MPIYFFLVMALPGGTTKGQQRVAQLVAVLGTPGPVRSNPQFAVEKVRVMGKQTETAVQMWLWDLGQSRHLS